MYQQRSRQNQRIRMLREEASVSENLENGKHQRPLQGGRHVGLLNSAKEERQTVCETPRHLPTI